MVDYISGWFTDHPLYDNDGQPIVVPPWRLPGPGSRPATADAGDPSAFSGREGTPRPAAAGQAGRVRGRPSRRSGWSWTQHSSTSQLYGLYTECEAIYQVDNLLELWDSLDDDDQRTFPFDPRVIDWEHYVTQIHLPSIVEHARVKSTPGKAKIVDRGDQAAQAGARPEAARRRVRPREHADRVERRRELLVAGHATARHPRAHPLRAAHTRRGARSAAARPPATAPTSCATSTAATRTRRSSRSSTTPAR